MNDGLIDNVVILFMKNSVNLPIKTIKAFLDVIVGVIDESTVLNSLIGNSFFIWLN